MSAANSDSRDRFIKTAWKSEFLKSSYFALRKDRAEHSSAQSQFMLSSQTWSQARNNCCTKLLPLPRLQAHTSWQLPNCEHHHAMLSPTAETALQAATSWWQQEDSAFQTLPAAATRSFTQDCTQEPLLWNSTELEPWSGYRMHFSILSAAWGVMCNLKLPEAQGGWFLAG